MAFSMANLQVDKRNRIGLEKQLKEIGTERITAGIHKEQGSQMVGKNTRLIDIAVQNEYGNEWIEPRTVRFQKNGKWYCIKKDTLIKIPATRFVGRLLTDKHERDLIKLEVFNQIYMMNASWNGFDNTKKITANTIPRHIGKFLVERIKNGIDRKIFDANSEMTIDIKGFDKRLYETGTLYDSLKWRSKKEKS